jgi:hypothetical protein
VPQASPPPIRFDRHGLLVLVLVALAVGYAWESWAVYPLRLFVVFLHEISHGIAAVATGGEVLEIQVFREEAGHCVTLGGSPVVILSAGYVGSMLLGAGTLLVATRTRAAPLLAAALGGGLICVALFYVPAHANAFGRGFAIAFGGALAALGMLPRRIWAEGALQVIGVTSCLYAVVDIKGDVLDHSGAPSDAVALAEITGVPSTVWGVTWIVASVVVGVLGAKWAVMRPAAADAGRAGDGLDAGEDGAAALARR